MGDIGDAIGTASEGALAGAVVEHEGHSGSPGPAPLDESGHTAEGRCLNCGTGLVGSHCHACGQRAHVHRTLGAFFHDLVHGVLHFDGKLWHTLPLLFWHPGRLTREYIEGRRARYVSPIALFLFVVFLTFAIWNMLGGIGNFEPEMNPAGRTELRRGIEQFDRQISATQDEIAAARQAGMDERRVRELEAKLLEYRTEKQIAEGLLRATGDAAPEARAKGDEASLATDPGSEAADNRMSWFNAAWRQAKANPDLLIYKMQNNAYKFSWLLIPLSLPFMWLLFPFDRRFGLYDHTVFATYSIAFMSILAVAASLAARWDLTVLMIATLLFAPVHLYRQLRGTYGLSRRGAAWRLVVLSAMIWFVLALFTAIVLTLAL